MSHLNIFGNERASKLFLKVS